MFTPLSTSQDQRSSDNRPIRRSNISYFKLFILAFGLALLLLLLTKQSNKVGNKFEDNKTFYNSTGVQFVLSDDYLKELEAELLQKTNSPQFTPIKPEIPLNNFPQIKTSRTFDHMTDITHQQFLIKVKQHSKDLQKQNQVIENSYYDNINSQLYVGSYLNTQAENSEYCFLINAVELSEKINLQTLDSQIQIIQKLHKTVWLFSTDKQVRVVSEYFNKKAIQIKSKKIDVDSTYGFITQLEDCQQLLFSRIQFIFKDFVLPSQQIFNNHTVLFATPQQRQQEMMNSDLKDLNNRQLDHISSSQIAGLLLFFNLSLLKISTPLNFAINNHYSITQMIAFPILATVFHSQQLKKAVGISYYFTEQLSNSRLFQLNRLVMNRNHLCFVNYPWNLRQANITDYKQYLFPFSQKKYQNLSIVTSLIYTSNQPLWPFIVLALDLFKKNQNIKIRIRSPNIKISLELYQASFTYCPASSTIFSSRHNIQIAPLLLDKSNSYHLCVNPDQANSKSIYYIIPNTYQNEKKRTVKEKLNQINWKEHYALFEHGGSLMNAQIFCEQLLRCINITDFKWKQSTFYESQIPLILMMLQTAKEHYKNQGEVLFKRRYFQDKTVPDLVQSQEMIGFHKRIKLFKYQMSNSIILQPSVYNALSNKGYRRNAIDLIPRIIHQISIGGLMKIQQNLSYLMESKHSSFKYKLWKQTDITPEQFPLTYNLLKFLLNSTKQINNLKNTILEIMKLEILYHYGGIYVDIDYEAKKPLTPFLKFEQFFSQIITQRNNQPNLLSQNVIGTIKHSPYFQFALKSCFLEHDFDVYNMNGIHQYLLNIDQCLANIYTDKDMEQKIVYGGNMFANFQHNQYSGPCHNLEIFDHDEIIYQFSFQRSLTKLTVPCRYSHEHYLDYYYQISNNLD